MKKKYLSLVVTIAMCCSAAILLAGCGDKTPYDYDLSEYVKVGEYKGLEYTVEEVSVSQEEIESEITSRREAKTETETVKSGTVADGDTVNISYVGKIDGEAFDGGSAEDKELTIGKDSYIEGFADGLIGKEIGKTIKLDLTFPTDYNNTELAGKDVVFEVTINSKKVSKVPEYNLDFVKKQGGDYSSLKEYEESVKKDLLKKKQSQADSDAKSALWKKIVDASEVIKYPDGVVEDRMESETKAYKAMADSYGMEWEDFLEQYMKYTVDEYYEAEKTYSESAVFQEMVMYYIARTEEIEVTDDEYEEYLADMLEEAGFTEETFKDSYGQSIEDYAKDQDFRTGLLLDKVLDKVMEYGKKTE